MSKTSSRLKSGDALPEDFDPLSFLDMLRFLNEGRQLDLPAAPHIPVLIDAI